MAGLAGVLTARVLGDVGPILEIVRVRMGGRGVSVKFVALVLRGFVDAEVTEVVRLRGGEMADAGFSFVGTGGFFSVLAPAARRIGVLFTSCGARGFTVDGFGPCPDLSFL